MAGAEFRWPRLALCSVLLLHLCTADVAYKCTRHVQGEKSDDARVQHAVLAPYVEHINITLLGPNYTGGYVSGVVVHACGAGGGAVSVRAARYSLSARRVRGPSALPITLDILKYIKGFSL